MKIFKSWLSCSGALYGGEVCVLFFFLSSSHWPPGLSKLFSSSLLDWCVCGRVCVHLSMRAYVNMCVCDVCMLV